MSLLTYDKATMMFSYDPDTGVVTRRKRSGNRSKGAIVGSRKTTKYPRLTVEVAGKKYYLHRIIWLLMTGEWPSEVDHVNHNGLDNRWVNLREATRLENNRNKPLRRSSGSGITGVLWDKSCQKWRSEITVSYIRHRIYYGDDFFEACCRRKSAEIKHGFHENCGLVSPFA